MTYSRLAGKVFIVYLAMGIGWILASDWLVFSAAPWWFQTAKGILYVVVTALVLYWLVRRSVRRLTDEEARYWAVFERSPTPIIVADDALRVVSMNPSALAFYHGSKGLSDVSELADLWIADERAAAVGHLREAMITGGSFETRQLSDNGKIRQVLITVCRLALRQGPLNLLFVQDLTGWRENEARIRMLNRTYEVISAVNQMITRVADVSEVLRSSCRIAVESGGFKLVWIGLFDRTTQRLKVVESAGDSDGYLQAIPGQLGGLPDRGCAVSLALRKGHSVTCPIAPGEDPQSPCKRAAWEKGLRASAAIPLRLAGQDTQGVIVFYASDPLTFNAEQMHLLEELSTDIAFALDFSENQRQRDATQVALNESEERFRLLVENAPDAVLVETEGRVAYMNEAAFRLIGAPAGTCMVGREIVDLLDPHSLKTLQNRILLLHRDKQAFRLVEDVFLRFDGTSLVCEVSAVPFRFDGKEGALVFIRDVSERNRAQEQLRQAQKMDMIGRLAGGVAHDFNNMLQVINGSAELAYEAVDAGSQARDLLGNIRKAGSSAAALVGRLLVFSRRQLLCRERIELNEMVSSTIHRLEWVNSPHVIMECSLSPEALHVYGDRCMLEQVLINLCLNARDAMAAGGVLSVSTETVQLDDAYCRQNAWARPGNYAVFHVADTGQGINVEAREHMFEPFFTTHKDGFGTGLGLSTVYSIVRQHEGLIQIISEAEKGTHVSVFLSSVKVPCGPVETGKVSGAANGGTETLLLAEDDEMVRKLTAYILRLGGYTVIEACDGVEAMDLFLANRGLIAGVLLDIIMPRMGGFEACERIHALDPRMPVLFASAFSEQALHKDVTLILGVNLLQKPFERSELLDAVRRLLDTRQQGGASAEVFTAGSPP